MSDPYELRADQLESAFSEMGLTVRRVSSRVSRSEYVEVESPGMYPYRLTNFRKLAAVHSHS